MNKRIEVRDSTPAEEAVDKLIRQIESAVPYGKSQEWIANVKEAARNVVYQEALSRIGSKSVRR